MASTIPVGFRALPLSVVQLSLAAVLKCGQSFRWTSYPLPSSPSAKSSPTHEYRLCLKDRIVCLRQSPDYLFYRSVFPGEPPSPAQEEARDEETLAWIKDYFQLDVDLVKLYDRWSERDQVFDKLKSRFSGIRVLRQDPWETLVSFICSSNNNIPRITKMVHALCKQYSPSLITLPPPSVSGNCSEGPATYHPFPPPSVLAVPDAKSTLRALGFGYRADYIQRTAKMLVDTHGSESCEEWLTRLRRMNTEDAREELLKFVGVGRKVADCVLLMSLDKREVIPVDTHVYQIAIKHYGLRTTGGSKAKSTMTPRVYEQVTATLVGIWGDFAGWAHSVLFTADLKAFSSFGTQTPTTAEDVDAPAAASSSLSLKRKQTEIKEQAEVRKRKRVEMRKKVVVVAALAAAAAAAVAAACDLNLLEDDGTSSAESDDDASEKRKKGSSD